MLYKFSGMYDIGVRFVEEMRKGKKILEENVRSKENLEEEV